MYVLSRVLRSRLKLVTPSSTMRWWLKQQLVPVFCCMAVSYRTVHRVSCTVLRSFRFVSHNIGLGLLRVSRRVTSWPLPQTNHKAKIFLLADHQSVHFLQSATEYPSSHEQCRKFSRHPAVVSRKILSSDDTAHVTVYNHIGNLLSKVMRELPNNSQYYLNASRG